MSKIKFKNNFISIFIIASIFAFGFYLFFDKEIELPSKVANTNFVSKAQSTIVEHKNLKPSINVESKYIKLLIGGKNLNVPISDGDTVYEMLLYAQGKKWIEIEDKEYTGLGFFITRIDDLAQENGKNLMYYINGEEASLGVSNYKLKDGDIVEWKVK